MAANKDVIKIVLDADGAASTVKGEAAIITILEDQSAASMFTGGASLQDISYMTASFFQILHDELGQQEAEYCITHGLEIMRQLQLNEAVDTDKKQ